MKICKKCTKEKDFTSYYKHSQMADGYLNICKDCTKTRVTKHRDENIEQIREYDRQRSTSDNRVKARKDYSLTEKGKQAHNRATGKWSKNNQPKRFAQQVAYRALKKGLIVKTPCKCGRTDDLEMHHPDYSKPLDVIFVCPACHGLEHDNTGKINIKHSTPKNT